MFIIYTLLILVVVFLVFFRRDALRNDAKLIFSALGGWLVRLFIIICVLLFVGFVVVFFLIPGKYIVGFGILTAALLLAMFITMPLKPFLITVSILSVAVVLIYGFITHLV